MTKSSYTYVSERRRRGIFFILWKEYFGERNTARHLTGHISICINFLGKLYRWDEWVYSCILFSYVLSVIYYVPLAPWTQTFHNKNIEDSRIVMVYNYKNFLFWNGIRNDMLKRKLVILTVRLFANRRFNLKVMEKIKLAVPYGADVIRGMKYERCGAGSGIVFSSNFGS